LGSGRTCIRAGRAALRSGARWLPFECREEAVLVEIEQAIRAAEIDGDDRGVVGAGVDVPGDAGAAAVRDQADVGRAGVIEPGAHLVVRGWVSHGVR